MTVPRDEYLEARVMTASAARLHLMVLDGAIRFGRQAAAALAERRFDAAHAALNSSRGCVAELISGLDPQHARELVRRVADLFSFVYRRLTDADARHDAQLVHDAVRVLEMHRETWLQLLQQLPPAASGCGAEVPAAMVDSAAFSPRGHVPPGGAPDDAPMRPSRSWIT